MILSLIHPLAFQEGKSVNIYPFLCLTGPRGSGKSYSLWYHSYLEWYFVLSIISVVKTIGLLGLFLQLISGLIEVSFIFFILFIRLSNHWNDTSFWWFLCSTWTLSEIASWCFFLSSFISFIASYNKWSSS